VICDVCRRKPEPPEETYAVRESRPLYRRNGFTRESNPRQVTGSYHCATPALSLLTLSSQFNMFQILSAMNFPSTIDPRRSLDLLYLSLKSRLICYLTLNFNKNAKYESSISDLNSTREHNRPIWAGITKPSYPALVMPLSGI
jgi:hypothetical protein